MISHGVEHEELQAYLDRELAPGRREEIARHLSSCAECSAVLRDLQQVSARLQAWQVEPAPATLRAPRIEEAKPAVRWTWPRLVLAFGGTAAVLLLVLAVSLPNLLKSRSMHSQKVTGLSGPARSQPLPPPEQKAAAPPPPAKEAEPQRARELARRQAASDAAAAPEEKFRAKEGRQEGDYADEVAKAAPAAPAAQAPAARGVSGGLMSAQSRANAEEARRLIAYYVTLTVEVKEFTPARDKLLRVVDKAGGYVSEAASAETPGQPRQAALTLRVPAEKLPGVLAELRALGRVLNEQLSTDEVTEQVVDLEARLRNARATEQRLIAVLNERTGKVRDILEVEREIARTRQEIERMEAQRQNLMRRVELATVQVSLIEEYKAPLAPAPVGTVVKLRNAFVAGYEDFTGMFIGLAFFFARNGLNLLFWFVILYLIWRRVKRYALRFVGSGLQA